MRQSKGCGSGLWAAGATLPVHVGMRNWHPFLAGHTRGDVEDGIRRAVGVHRRRPSQLFRMPAVPRERDRCARQARRAELADVEITYVDDWYMDAGFVRRTPTTSGSARAPPRRSARRARLVFTAHSIPVSMAERYPYEAQYGQTARLVAGRRDGIDDFATGVSEPQRTSRGSLAGPRRRRVPAPGESRRRRPQSCCPRSDSSAITSRSSTTSTSRRGCVPRNRAADGTRGSGQHASAIPGHGRRRGHATLKRYATGLATRDCPTGTTPRRLGSSCRTVGSTALHR